MKIFPPVIGTEKICLLLWFCTYCRTVWLFFKFLIHFGFDFLKDSSELISLPVLRQGFTNFPKNLERTLKFSSPEGWHQASSVLGTRSIRGHRTKFNRPVARCVCSPVSAVSVLTDVHRCVVDGTAAEYLKGPRFKSYPKGVLTSMLVFYKPLCHSYQLPNTKYSHDVWRNELEWIKTNENCVSGCIDLIAHGNRLYFLLPVLLGVRRMYMIAEVAIVIVAKGFIIGFHVGANWVAHSHAVFPEDGEWSCSWNVPF